MPKDQKMQRSSSLKKKLPGEDKEIGIKAVKAALRYQSKRRPAEQRQQQQNNPQNQWE